jgi:hypothetical protein
VLEGAAAEEEEEEEGFCRLAAVCVGLLAAAKVWDRRALNRAWSAAMALGYIVTLLR